MGFFSSILGLTAGLALFKTAQAGLDLESNTTVAVYWGQNSFRGTGDLAQQRLSYYCNDPNIDVLILAFVMRVNGMGGAPEVDFSTASEKCSTFDGTNLKNCPDIGADITTCQKKGKSIILSIGGATYSEGGFPSEAEAKAGADLIWATFGPPSGSKNRKTTAHAAAHRPFGDASVDGFDFDFEATVTNMAPFAKRLRSLADKSSQKSFFLTAAPQCPFPDAADKDILTNSVDIDAVWVQFYNNYCGVNAFTAGSKEQTNFNFQTWDDWAQKDSFNKKAKIYLGVPANTGAASTGYVPADQLAGAIEYAKEFPSFGGVMMWDVTQAYGNKGFLDGVGQALGRKGESHAPHTSVHVPVHPPTELPVHPPTEVPVHPRPPVATHATTLQTAVQVPVQTAVQTAVQAPPAPAPGPDNKHGPLAGLAGLIPHFLDGEEFNLDNLFP